MSRMIWMIRAVFNGVCPNCMGPISSTRLEKGLLCSKCIPMKSIDYSILREKNNIKRIVKLSRVARRFREGSFTMLGEILEELLNFEELFKKAIGSEMWSLQRTWALRLVLGESFAITAPTGVGKTTLLAVYAVYSALQGKKVYILVPTEYLAQQFEDKLKEIIGRLRAQDLLSELIVYKSRERRQVREEKINRILNSNFKIVVTTTAFLSRRSFIAEKLKVDIVLVDDADSLLKNSKNIDRVLMLIGFNENDIRNAYDLIKVKMELIIKKASGDSRKIEELLEKFEKLQLSIDEARVEKRIGQLVIASATGRQRGVKPKLFRELLDFEVGGIHDYMRNIIEAYKIMPSREMLNETLRLIKKLGWGGLVFVSRDKGVQEAKRIVRYLREHGVKAELAVSGKRVLNKLRSREADVLVGVASYYGVIVRGIDLPEVVKYAIFYGVPKNKIALEKALESPKRLLQALLYTYPDDEDTKWIQKAITKLTPNQLMALRIAFSNNKVNELTGFLGDLASKMKNAIRKVCDKLNKELHEGEEYGIGTAVIIKENGRLYLVSPDPLTYIQASGRTSRFLNDRMTLGFSIILESDREVYNAFKKKVNIYLSAFNPNELDKLDISLVRKLLESSRMGGEGSIKYEPAKSVLFVVESPNKARTIARFFGRPSRRRFSGITVYEVPIVDPETRKTYLALIVATKGHIYDLVIENIGNYGVIVNGSDIIPVFSPIIKCRACGHNYSSINTKCPRCGSSLYASSSINTIHLLRKLALEVEDVLIATDPDVEGEKIAWDVAVSIKPFNNRIWRAEFHEVTREAILKALRSLSGININRVKAQVVRRVTDRWIGFALSEKLWSVYGKRFLGAGRVQTPVLGWIIDKYLRWRESRGYWVILKAKEAPTIKLFVKNKDEGNEIIDEVSRENRVEVLEYSVSEEEFNPPPPFTTDMLIYEASRKLGYTAEKTMRLAQNLFEAGLITYHRTDSTRVSVKGMGVAKEYLKRIGLEELYHPRSWSDKGAHEAIRPVMPLSVEDLRKAIIEGSIKISVNLTEQHYMLYDLIFKRFIASQIKSSRLLKVNAKLNVGGVEVNIEAPVKEYGGMLASFLDLKLYNKILESIKRGFIEIEKIMLVKGSLEKLYTQGDVVKLMREREIGRPSTYAKILDSIRRHGYIVVSKKRKYLIPTKIGIEVYNYLVRNYRKLVSEERTRMLEEEIDLIEKGELEYTLCLFKLLRELEDANLIRVTGGVSLDYNYMLEEALA